jgi:glycosyltransferase involved in cell wall biosynthesis
MKAKLCFVVSAPMTVIAFLNDHIDYLSTDFEITVVCKFDGDENMISNNAALENIEISRKVSLISDLKSIYQLTRFLRKNNFLIVHSLTPKAGLIAAISGWLAHTPIRVHWFTGQIWVLKSGVQRMLLKSLDRIVAAVNTSLLVDSPSQRDFLIEQGIVTAKKSQVLGSGSISGVNSKRFRPNPQAKNRIRFELGITDPNALIILFLGRLNPDKGIDTLLAAFNHTQIPPNCYLLLVGPDEANYLARVPAILGSKQNRFRHVPQILNPEDYMAASDILCLPSLREGFGLVLIEAAACGLPAIASRIYGITDALVDGETGLLFEPSDSIELRLKLATLLANTRQRKEMGRRARRNAGFRWDQQELHARLTKFYMDEMDECESTARKDGVV